MRGSTVTVVLCLQMTITVKLSFIVILGLTLGFGIITSDMEIRGVRHNLTTSVNVDEAPF